MTRRLILQGPRLAIAVTYLQGHQKFSKDTALDPQRQIKVLEFLRALTQREGLLVLIDIHDLSQALRFTDKTLVLAGGTARGSGPSEAVITVAMLREVYGIEARIERCSLGSRHVIVDGAAR